MTHESDYLRQISELKRQRREAWRNALLDAAGLCSLFAILTLLWGIYGDKS